jgi:predicted cupin superfamily sugar epimerase
MTNTDLHRQDARDTEAARTARALIAALDLQPHPEGGHFREVFRATQPVIHQGRERCAATSIFYLLADGACSAWHRIDADETWYHHAGGLLLLHVLQADGGLVTHRLGHPLRHAGAQFQAVVPAGAWFAAELSAPDDFALMGCAVAPGFEFAGFELAREADLAAALRRQGDWIRRLLKP